MKRTRAILSLILLLLLAACGKPARDDRNAPGGEPEGRRAVVAPEGGERTSGVTVPAAEKRRGGEQSLLRLQEVRLRPEALTADSELTAEPVALDALPDAAAFEFRWFLNNEALEDVSGPTLAPGRIKKKQWLHCQARAVAGDQSGPWQSSRHVQVINLPPRIETRPVEEFSLPTQISYQIVASDPDEDPLSYELLSPLAVGIAIDPASGLLTWKLDAETAEKLGKSIEIKFMVKDNDGAGCSGSITLQWAETTGE